MGLSAGQARLLCITARKSNCEYQSMQMSHQKLAISRNLENVSNEYQNSLEQTKLVYDFYGTGTTNTQLSYPILMSPSELNNYMPALLTNSSGQAVLDSKYAAAARAAGIPQEGLGGIPSDTVRNTFIDALAANGLITEARATNFKNTAYNQLAGLGASSSVAITTADCSYSDFIELLDNVDYNVNPTDTASYNNDISRGLLLFDDRTLVSAYRDDLGDTLGGTPTNDKITLGDILNGNYSLVGIGQDDKNYALGDPGGAVDAIANSSVWDSMFDAIESLLDTGDAYTQEALAYARQEIEFMIENQFIPSSESGTDKRNPKKQCSDGIVTNFVEVTGGADDANDDSVYKQALDKSNNDNHGNVGYGMRFNCDTGHDNNSDLSAVSINLSNIANAYLTFFARKMEGLASSSYIVGTTKNTSNFVDDNFTFTINTGTSISEDELKMVNFYDTLLNQICTKGWVENENINDNEYLQEMLQNGMMYLTKIKDDGYYYQGNYATDAYIKTIEDETAIAQAEAKYTAEKQKLTSKENTLDMKMKNLDTEISALTTEYDTVKSTIQKNIERSFKRYSA